MKNKHYAYTTILSAMGIILLQACGDKPQDPKSKTPPPIAIDVMVAKHSSFSQTLYASGTVQAQEFVELKPEVSGRIIKLNINEGETVKEGTLLVKLNDDDLQAQLRKFQSQLDIAQRNLKRLKSLLDANGLNQQEYDAADNQVKTTLADIDYIKAQIHKTEIIAPFTGLIGLRKVSPGAFITNNTVLATLQQVNSLKIDFVIPEDEAGVLHRGSKVKIQNDNNDELLDATISAIEPQVNVGTRNLTYRAVLSSRTSTLNPGAFVKVLFDAGKNNDAIMVPSNCIIPESRNKKVVLIKDGKVKFTIVEVGYRGNDMVEITKGLIVGDTIAVNGLLFLKPDAIVKIKGAKNKS
jgi:membrane fusion protein (multidrug efflux system)